MGTGKERGARMRSKSFGREKVNFFFPSFLPSILAAQPYRQHKSWRSLALSCAKNLSHQIHSPMYSSRRFCTSAFSSWKMVEEINEVILVPFTECKLIGCVRCLKLIILVKLFKVWNYNFSELWFVKTIVVDEDRGLLLCNEKVISSSVY